MKRKLFIGSSKEGMKIAEEVKAQVNAVCGSWIEAETWSDGNIFALNSSTLHSLVVASRTFDYGILVATQDDVVTTRGKVHIIPRDNVMFEMGMFLGSLGLTRAFLLVEENAKLPTDYNGVTVPYFQSNVAGSLDRAIDQIIKSIESTQNTFNLRPAPSVALALGYFENFVQILAKRRQTQEIDFKLQILIPKSIKDIHAETKEYKRSNISEEISVFDDGQRPRVYKRQNSEDEYWDIPTTLGTLSRLLDLILPSTEIGISKEKKEWIGHELRSFAGALRHLIEECPACRNRVEVLFLP